jgi:hypothetical protein
MVTHTNTGIYVIKDGDTPHSVANYVYNDKTMYHVLIKENPQDWVPGFPIEVPNKKGRQTEVLPEEGAFDVIRRMFPNQPIHLYLDRFYGWNGGDEYQPEAGDFVYVPER